MRKVTLNPSDYDLFNTDIDPLEHEFLLKHKDAFKRMWHEQGREFWIKFIATFQSFAVKFGFIKEKEHESIKECFDPAFIYLHEQFVDGKFKDAKDLFDDVVIIAQNKNLIVNLTSKSFAKDPFYKKETRDTFRKLFGQPNEKESFIKVYLLLPMYTKFGGAVVKCLRRWLEADEIAVEKQKEWLSLMDSLAVSLVEKPVEMSVENTNCVGTMCEYCKEIIKDETESHKPGPWEPDWIIYMKETESGRRCGPCWTYGWPPHEDPRFHDKRNPLFKIKADPLTDWRVKLTFNKYTKFSEYVREVYVPRMTSIPYKPEVELVNKMVFKFFKDGGTEKAMRDRMHGMMAAAQNGNLATTMQQWFQVGLEPSTINHTASTISKCAAIATTLPGSVNLPALPEPKKSKKKSKKAITASENTVEEASNDAPTQQILSIASFTRAAKIAGELAEMSEEKKGLAQGRPELDWPDAKSDEDGDDAEKPRAVIHVIKLGAGAESPEPEEEEKPKIEYNIKEYDWERKLNSTEGIMNVKILSRRQDDASDTHEWTVVRYYSSRYKRWHESPTNGSHGDSYPHSLTEYPHVPRSGSYTADSAVILDLILQHSGKDSGKCDCSTCRSWMANTEDEKFKTLLTELLFGEELSPAQELGLQDPDKKTLLKDRLRRKQIDKFLESEREKINGGMVNVPPDTRRVFEQIWDEFKIKSNKSSTPMVWPYKQDGNHNGKKEFMKRVMELYVRRKIFEEEILGLHPRAASEAGNHSPVKKREKRDRKTSKSPESGPPSHGKSVEAGANSMSGGGLGQAAAGTSPTLSIGKWDDSEEIRKLVLSKMPLLNNCPESFGDKESDSRADKEWRHAFREKVDKLHDEEGLHSFLQITENFVPNKTETTVKAELAERDAMVIARRKTEDKSQTELAPPKKSEKKLRVCGNSECAKVEPVFRTYKKCLSCKEKKFRPASYYCGKDCQVKDWTRQHKAFHRLLNANVKVYILP